MTKTPSAQTRRGILGGLAATGVAAGAPAVAQPRQPANVSRAPGYPNLLVVRGIDPTVEYRDALKATIATAVDSPVQRGSHDFWLAFPYPRQLSDNTAAPNFGRGDAGPPENPLQTRLLGIGDMRGMPPPAYSDFDMRARVNTAVHEWAHAWLVAGDMTLRMADGSTTTPMTYTELATALYNDQPLVRPALMGRGDSHWNCYVNFASCMDALNWDRTPSSPGYMKWVQTNPPAPVLRPPGEAPLTLDLTLSDLDLYMAGAKRAQDCFPATGGQFYWLEPKLSTGIPMKYLSGIFIAFGVNDYLTFGFSDDHGRLEVRRSRDDYRAGATLIGPDYNPLREEKEAMMLRIIKRGGRYLFQACRGNSAAATLGAILGQGRQPMMFDDIDATASAPGSGNFSGWQTVWSMVDAGVPVAMGVINQTANAITVESQIFSFEVRRNGVSSAFPVANIIRHFSASLPYSLLPGDRLMYQVPRAAAYCRTRGISAVLGAPFSAVYDCNASVNHAPKLLMAAPAGDFTVGATIKVRRSFVSPQSWGAATGMTIIGVERTANVRDVTVPARIRDIWRPAPANFRCAFIVPTSLALSITAADYAALERMRKYFTLAVPAATGGLMSVTTTL